MSIALSIFGLKKRQIYETVVSTYDANRRPTAAPMGIILRNRDIFLIRPYKTSSAYRNLCETRCGVVNITSSPELFYRTTFKHEEQRLEIPARWFAPAKAVQAPRIKSAEGHVEFTVKRLDEENEDRARFTCKVQMVESRRSFPQAYCRSKYALIECIIHATRIKQYLSDGRLAEAEKLINLVEYYRDLTDRVSSGSKDAQMVEDILSHIGRWRRTHASLR